MNCLGCRWLELIRETLALRCEQYGGSAKMPDSAVLGRGLCKRKGKKNERL